MNKISILLYLVINNIVFSSEITCQQARGIRARMKIKLKDDIPVALYLEDTKSGNFRKQDKVIHPLFSDVDNQYFLAKNLPPSNINWAQEPFCYKDIGTQWYFNITSRDDESMVQFYPDIVTKDSSCVPPRFEPQSLKLDCIWTI